MDDLSVALIVLVILVFMLFIMRIITLSLRSMALTRQMKQEARQRAQGNGNQGCGQATIANTNVCATVTPKTDAPPAYEDVVRNYIDAKQQLQAAEEGAVGGGIPLAVSTSTLETVLESGSSATDLNAITSITTRTTTTTDLNHNHIV